MHRSFTALQTRRRDGVGCHSTNLVKVSLVYEQGLSDYQGQSRSGGLFAGTGGLGLWGGRTTSAGTSQTRLSTRLKPPHRSEKTHEQNMNAVKMLRPVFGALRLSEISPEGIEDCIKTRLTEGRRIHTKFVLIVSSR